MRRRGCTQRNLSDQLCALHLIDLRQIPNTLSTAPHHSNLPANESGILIVNELAAKPTPVTPLIEVIVLSPSEFSMNHDCVAGSVTRREWARSIAHSKGFSRDKIVLANTSNFATVAQRSIRVVLSFAKLLSTGLMIGRPWEDYQPALTTTLRSGIVGAYS